MATETDYYCHDHEGYLKSWSFPELPVSEDVPISEILDHGSISFGRYATESLAWEKWSAFSHNRCQEELEKCKAPGLVAQKKAYFEEYYKKIRAMKALQAQQETAQPDSCQAANSGSVQVETDVKLMMSQEEKTPSNVSQIPNSDNNMISNLNSTSGGTVNESEQATEKRQSYPNECNDQASMKGKMELSFCTSVKKASPLLTPSSHSSKSTQRSSHVSNTVNNNTNQQKKLASALQAEGTVASIRNKTKLDSSGSTTNNVKQSAKPYPTLNGKSVHKDDKSHLTSKNSDPKAASNSNRKITEFRSSAAVLTSSLARDRLVSPLPSPSARQATPNTNSRGLVGNRKITEVHSSAAVLNSSLARDGLVSPLSSPRARQATPNTTSRGMAGKNSDPKAASNSNRKITEVRSVLNSSLARDGLVSPLSSPRARQVTPSTTSRGLAGKNCDPKTASNSNRKITEVRSSVPGLNSLLARDGLVSPLSSPRAHQVTQNTTSKGLAEKIPTRSSVHAQSAKLVSSSSNIRGACKVKTSTTSQGLVDKLPPRLSVHSRSAKRISEKTISAGSLRTTALSKRSVDLSMQNKSNHGQSDVKEGMQKEGKDKLSAALGREPKAALSAKLNKDSNAALAREPKAALSARPRKDSNAALGREPNAALSARPRKDSNAALAREPKAVLSARPRKDSNAALAREPKAALSTRPRKDSNAALAREPKAALSARPRKDSNAALGREPKAASSAGLRTNSKRASSTVSNVPQTRNAKLTQKVVPCRSPDLMDDRRELTQPRPRLLQ
ncbi:hypothetical protein ACOSQ4_009280 [Xanthoceras sorbifolium]